MDIYESPDSAPLLFFRERYEGIQVYATHLTYPNYRNRTFLHVFALFFVSLSGLSSAERLNPFQQLLYDGWPAPTSQPFSRVSISHQSLPPFLFPLPSAVATPIFWGICFIARLRSEFHSSKSSVSLGSIHIFRHFVLLIGLRSCGSFLILR